MVASFYIDIVKERNFQKDCGFFLGSVPPGRWHEPPSQTYPHTMKSAHDDRTDVPSHSSKKSASSPKVLSLGTEADFLLECDGMLMRSSCTPLMV